MKTLKLLTLTMLAACLYSCKPKPLNIEIKQTPPVLTLSSATPDNHTVLVSAGYSINSLIKLNDTANGSVKIPKDMLLNDGILTITRTGGNTDTLYFISDGLYGNVNIPLEQDETYTINVYERDKGHIAMATTTYKPLPPVSAGRPEINRVKGDTTVSVTLKINNVQEGDYYFISYNTAANTRKQSRTPNMDVSTLAAFTPKQLTLVSAQDSKNGAIERKITIPVKTTDTLLIQTAKVDKAYFDYLTTYKRSGSLINQLTGEPINMPSNIMKGFGFFSLFSPDRKIFYMADY